MIAAVSTNGVIGNSKLDKMPWHCSDELKFFKNETMGKTLVMGRTTAEQVGKLPGRDAIVLSRDPNYQLAGFAHMTLDEFLFHHSITPDVDYMICGGAEIYKAFLPYIDYATISYLHFPAEGDVMLPLLDDDWEILEELVHEEFTVIKRRRPE
jgi:dihydrofolate reductase